MAIELRPYQEQLVHGIRNSFATGHRRVIGQAPTGAGKSVIMAVMLQRAVAKNPRTTCWIVAHRRELLDQISHTLWQVGLRHSWIMAGREYHPFNRLQVASIQTLRGRMNKLKPPDILVVDEAHHCTSKTYRDLMARCAKSWTIGWTATPSRLDGAPLGNLFDGLVIGPSVSELVGEGHLSPFRVLGSMPTAPEGMRTRMGDWVKSDIESWLERSEIIGEAVPHYLKYVYPGTCLVFCHSRAKAREVRDLYLAKGLSAAYIGGDTQGSDRNRRIAALRSGQLKIVTSVDLFGEGLDCPGLNAVQLLRPTKSLTLYLQQIGRALRPEAGKQEAIILDHAKNVWRHGMPDAQRKWVLKKEEVRKKRARGPTGPRLSHCQKCFAIFGAAQRCPQCGTPVKVYARDLKTRKGELVEIKPEEPKKAIPRGATLDELIQIARERGYKPGWAHHRLAWQNKIRRRG